MALLQPTDVMHVTALNKEDPEYQDAVEDEENIILTIPDGTTKIEEGAFLHSRYITEVRFPESLKEIGEDAFSRCIALSRVHLPSSLTKIGNMAFAGCKALIEIHLPDSLTEFGDKVFVSCSGLSQVRLPGSLTTIGYGTFRDCTGLSQVELPDSLTTIGDETFQKCTSLAEIHIPVSLKRIGRRCFDRCTALSDVYCSSTKVKLFKYIGVMIYGDFVTRKAIVTFHCPAVARFLNGDSFDMELELKLKLSNGELEGDLKEQIKTKLGEDFLDGQDIALSDEVTKDAIIRGRVDFEKDLAILFV